MENKFDFSGSAFKDKNFWKGFLITLLIVGFGFGVYYEWKVLNSELDFIAESYILYADSKLLDGNISGQKEGSQAVWALLSQQYFTTGKLTLPVKTNNGSGYIIFNPQPTTK